MRERELEALAEQLFDVWAADALGLVNLDDLEDLFADSQHSLFLFFLFFSWSPLTYVDGSESGTVTSSHVLVHGLDGIGSGHLSVLLVHVVCAGARVVDNPDTEVLDLEWSLLVDLFQGQPS